MSVFCFPTREGPAVRSCSCLCLRRVITKGKWRVSPFSILYLFFFYLPVLVGHTHTHTHTEERNLIKCWICLSPTSELYTLLWTCHNRITRSVKGETRDRTTATKGGPEELIDTQLKEPKSCIYIPCRLTPFPYKKVFFFFSWPFWTEGDVSTTSQDAIIWSNMYFELEISEPYALPLHAPCMC